MRKQTRIIIGVVLGLFIVAAVLWIPGYDRAGVHPELLAVEEPLQDAIASYFLDGGSIGLALVDARGQTSVFTLPVKDVGGEPTYPEIIVGVTDGRGRSGVNHPCSGDSHKFIAMLIDKYAESGRERENCLEVLRNAPRDRLRRCWFQLTH